MFPFFSTDLQLCCIGFSFYHYSSIHAQLILDAAKFGNVQALEKLLNYPLVHDIKLELVNALCKVSKFITIFFCFLIMIGIIILFILICLGISYISINSCSRIWSFKMFNFIIKTWC